MQKKHIFYISEYEVKNLSFYLTLSKAS